MWLTWMQGTCRRHCKRYANEYDCIFKLKDRIKVLAKGVKIPPVIGGEKEEES